MIAKLDQERAGWRARCRAAGAAGAALTLLLLAAGCGSEAESSYAPAAVVEAARVEPRNFSERLELVGQLTAAESVMIRPEIAGVVESVAFREGQRVEAGELLFTLRSGEQRAAVREANAQRALALDVFKRTEALSKVKVSALSELDRARAEVEAAEANVDMARINLERTEIRAPFDGALGARLVSPGDRIDSDTDLVQIDAVEKLRLEFSLPESAVSLAGIGLAVSVQVAAFPDEPFAGEVYFVSPSLDPTSRRLPLKAWVANQEGRLRPGMFGRVEIEVDRVHSALVVPDGAIAFDAAGTFVWRVSDEQRAERVKVELGPRQDGQVVVRSGIAAGDVIVTSGNLKLFPGIAVQIREPAKDVAASTEPN
ncbi:MAG TPA: efflux RND transporter periplasmic adaptor subunit [Myxococcota bacterium]